MKIEKSYIDWYQFTGYLPNGVEAIEAMLAAASIGAVWSSTSPDFGVSVSIKSHMKISLTVWVTITAK